MRSAADLDATMDKHPATPSPALPARELSRPAAALIRAPGDLTLVSLAK